jgi:CheY-like chemotaxis protein
MNQTGCPCCGRDIAAEWEFDIRPVKLYRTWRPDSHRPGSTVPLCEGCAEWLGGLAAAARTPDGMHRVLGGPSASGRNLVFEDQCQVCCEMPAERAARLAWVSPAGKRLELFACTGCEAWLTALASDGRTVRGAADRDLDGPYGHWPHPNLRGLHVHLDIEDHGARALVAETCRAMGLVLTADSADILLTQATAGGHAARMMRERKPNDLSFVVLAGLRARRDLAQALEAGARAWTTVPVTPQQVTAAISRASRGDYGAWDPETCLPIVDNELIERPVVQCTPLPGTDLFELGWLLKRFSRGYDDIAWHNGTVLVIPRAPSDHVAGVAERLSILVDGRCEFHVVRPRDLAPVRRFEAAG